MESLNAPSQDYFSKTIPGLYPCRETGTSFLSLDNGFLPRNPLPSLPEPYSAWEEQAKRLPFIAKSNQWELFISELPLLQTEDLSEEHLLRTNLTVAIIAHAIQNVGKLPVPECIMVPWKEVSDRLGRPVPSLSAFDLLCYNIDATTDGITGEKQFKPSITMTGSMAEINFISQSYMFERKAAPLPGIIVRAQQAVVQCDRDDLRMALIELINVIENMTVSFQSANPRPNNPFFMDHVEWGRAMDVQTNTVLQNEKTGSGLLLPSIHLLDSFFARDRYESQMGKLALRDRCWMPELHRGFFEAVSSISVHNYILNCCSGEKHSLEILFNRALCSFASESGFLGKHRVRLTGYLEMSFKVGRQSTGSGLKSGPTWSLRAWRRVNDAMLEAMEERLGGSLDWTHSAKVTECRLLEGFQDVFKLTIDTNGTLVYKPGDHVAFLAQNNSRLIQEALDVLGMKRCTKITITDDAWLHSLANRGLGETSEKWRKTKESRITVERFLKYASLEPWSSVIKARHDMSEHPDLGLDCLFRPLLPRFYSVASHMSDSPTSVSIVFRRVQYETGGRRYPLSDLGCNPLSIRIFQDQFNNIAAPKVSPKYEYKQSNRSAKSCHPSQLGRSARTVNGVSSSYLSALRPGQMVSARIVPELSFRLPEDPNIPVIMISLGLGVTPFLSFLRELEIRSRGIYPSQNKSWLILGTRSSRSIPFLKSIEKAACEQKLINISAAISREQVELDEEASCDKLVFQKGQPKHVYDLIEGNQALLERFWNIIRNGGHIYACGKPELEPITRRLIASVAKQFAWKGKPVQPGDVELGYGRSPEDYVAKLAGEGKLHFDCYNSGKPFIPERNLTPADVAEQNTFSSAWVIFRDCVYDITEYLQMHPGGPKILLDKAGRDMTTDFEITHGMENSRIESILESYKIGRLRKFASLSTCGNVMIDMSVPLLHGVLERRSVFLLDWNSFPELNEPLSFVNWRSHHSSKRYLRELCSKFQEKYEPEMFSFVMGRVMNWFDSVFRDTYDLNKLRRSLENGRMSAIENSASEGIGQGLDVLEYLEKCSAFLDKWVEFAVKLQRIVESEMDSCGEERAEQKIVRLRNSIATHLKKGIVALYEEMHVPHLL